MGRLPDRVNALPIAGAGVLAGGRPKLLASTYGGFPTSI